MTKEQIQVQKDWDTCLLNGFYKYPDCNSYFLRQQFLVTQGLTDEDAKHIKRFPNGQAQTRVTILRFICAYLPKIAEILWKHKPEEIETLANVMSKSNYDCQEKMSDITQWKEDVSQIVKGQRQFEVAKNKKKEIKKLYESHRANSTWSITK